MEAVSEALAVWEAAPVSAELAAAAAALAAWAAAAATAAAQDADAEHFLTLERTTSAADAISYHICRAGVIFCLFSSALPSSRNHVFRNLMQDN